MAHYGFSLHCLEIQPLSVFALSGSIRFCICGLLGFEYQFCFVMLSYLSHQYFLCNCGICAVSQRVRRCFEMPNGGVYKPHGTYAASAHALVMQG